MNETENNATADISPSRAREIEIVQDADFNYDGYQVVRGEFFAHMYEPSFAFSNYKVSVNTACIRKGAVSISKLQFFSPLFSNHAVFVQIGRNNAFQRFLAQIVLHLPKIGMRFFQRFIKFSRIDIHDDSSLST